MYENIKVHSIIVCPPQNTCFNYSGLYTKTSSKGPETQASSFVSVGEAGGCYAFWWAQGHGNVVTLAGLRESRNDEEVVAGGVVAVAIVALGLG